MYPVTAGGRLFTFVVLMVGPTFLSLADDGRSTGGDIVIFIGVPSHVDSADKRGLLITGFVYVVASACMQRLLLFY